MKRKFNPRGTHTHTQPRVRANVISEKLLLSVGAFWGERISPRGYLRLPKKGLVSLEAGASCWPPSLLFMSAYFSAKGKIYCHVAFTLDGPNGGCSLPICASSEGSLVWGVWDLKRKRWGRQAARLETFREVKFVLMLWWEIELLEKVGYSFDELL